MLKAKKEMTLDARQGELQVRPIDKDVGNVLTLMEMSSNLKGEIRAQISLKSRGMKSLKLKKCCV